MYPQNKAPIITLPDNRLDSNKIIRLSPRRSLSGDDVVWEETDKIVQDRESSYITGDLAYRISRLLNLSYSDYESNEVIKSPQCHGAAMYAMGMTHPITEIFLGEFKDIYGRIPPKFSFQAQSAPSLMHLLKKEPDSLTVDELIKTQDITYANIKDAFAKHMSASIITKEEKEYIMPHSVVYLGKMNGHDICFEKRGKNGYHFSKVESVEENYETSVRVFVQPMLTVPVVYRCTSIDETYNRLKKNLKRIDIQVMHDM